MPISSCTCPHCVAACKRVPGVFAPLEALAAVRAGFADDIMSRWDESGRGADYKTWLSLMPRSFPVRFHGAPAQDRNHRTDPTYCAGRCVFLDADSRCAIHDFGFKPRECRLSLICDDAKDSVSNPTREMWNSSVGRHVVAIWERELVALRDAEERITDG